MSKRTIGFDRDIKLDWLDSVAGQVAAGKTPAEVRVHIHRMLGTTLARAALPKTTTVLLHLWSDVPEPAIALRDRAARIMSELSPQDRVAAHWAMSIATYPFFADVATNTGRLLSLQGDVQIAALRRRLAERWGDRSLMPQAARKILRSMINWGVLRDLKRGVYTHSTRPLCPGKQAAELLVEALLIYGERRAIPIPEIDAHPTLFPFKTGVMAHHLRSAKQFNVHRQGVDMEVVELSAK